MEISKINLHNRILKTLIENSLIDTMIQLDRICKPQEPDYVAFLSTKFIKDFYHILSAVFPEYNFSLTGVYCHQKPIVDIGLDKKPEVGDILFVYADRNQQGEIKYNSLLFQAKMSNRDLLRIPLSEQHQLKLYEKWPIFTYYRAGYLNGQKRNILPKSINDGAQYLLIDNNPMTNGIVCRDGMFPMGCAVPDECLVVNNSLSDELIDFLKFKSGRTFDFDLYTEDGWSQMIMDLLKIAARKSTRRKNSKLNSFPRSTEFIHLSSDGLKDRSVFDNMLNQVIYQEDISEENAGVSVIMIESSPRYQNG